MLNKSLAAFVMALVNINALASELTVPRIPQDIYIISSLEYEEEFFSQNQSKFPITTEAGVKLTLEQFLTETQTDISDIENVEVLLKEQPQIIMKLLLKLLSENSKKDLGTLEKNLRKILQTDKIIKSLPFPTSPAEKLANLLLELVMWTRTESFIAEMATDSMKGLVFKSPESTELKTLVNRTWELLAENAWFMTEFGYHNKVGSLIESYIGKDLLSFLLATNYQDQDLSEVVEPTFQGTLMICQFMNFAIRHSQEFKEMQINLNELISAQIDKDQILKILNNFNLPEATTGNDFTDTQLQIIHHMLQASV